MKVRYKYELVLSLANREVEIKKISKEIELSVKEFNIRSSSAKNVKQIIDWKIKEEGNLLYIWLDSSNKMGAPLRGLFLFSKLIIEQLDSGDEEKKNLLKNIIRNKCFFKLVEEPKETTNLRLEKTGENQAINLTKSEKEVKKKGMSIENLFMIIEKLEKRIEKLEELLGIQK